MDSDSAYMALTSELQDVIKPHMHEEFWTNFGSWFPRKYCEQHHTSFVDTMLQNHQWSMSNVDDKYRSKGLSRRQNKLTREQFMVVLKSTHSVTGQNTSFRKMDHSIFTYSQLCAGL